MTVSDIPEGFERQSRRSPLTDPWEPIYSKQTPDAIIRRLNQEIRRAQAGLKEKLLNDGAEVLDMSPEQFAAAMKSDMARWGKVIKDADIRAE